MKGRAREGLGCGDPRLGLLSLPRSGHRHEGSQSEMTVLAPAWSPTVRIPGAQGGGKVEKCGDGQSGEGRWAGGRGGQGGKGWTGMGATGRGERNLRGMGGVGKLERMGERS